MTTQKDSATDKAKSKRPIVRVGEVMTPDVRKIDGLGTVAEAIDVMREARVSCLIIDRRHEGDEYGMVLVHDIAEKVISPDKAPERVNVYEIMTKPVLTVNVDMDIRYAIRLLSRYGLSRAIVTRDGDMCGIVTLRDMAIRTHGLAKR